jgi:hypothetical protein
VPEKQPCNTSCVHTSIAIALGLTPEYIIKKSEGLGIDHSDGMTDMDTRYLLVSLGIGTLEITNHEAIGLLDGHYLVGTTSLNTLGLLHCVFVHILEGIPLVLDPNQGREDREYYSDWYKLGIIGLTALYDFKEYKGA